MKVPVSLGVVTAADALRGQAAALERAHFDEALLAREVAQLSGGERQRLALARALLLDPEVLLVDEPTSSLDGENAARVLESLTRWQMESGRTMVLVTHRLADVQKIADQLLMLDGGRIRHAGPSSAILESAAGDDIRRVLAGEDPGALRS